MKNPGVNWVGAWAAGSMTFAAGVLLAREIAWPTWPQVLIGVAITAGSAFLVSTMRAHVRAGTSYIGVAVALLVVGCLMGAGVIPLHLGSTELGVTLLVAAVGILLLTRPRRQPGRNIYVFGPSERIVWTGTLETVPRIRVFLGYVTVDCSSADWSQVTELQVTQFCSRLELVVPPVLGELGTINMGLGLNVESPTRRPTLRPSFTVSFFGALGSAVVTQSIEIVEAAAPSEADDP